MGSLDQEMTVVDPNMKVKGLKNIRIIDASIFPVEFFLANSVTSFTLRATAVSMTHNQLFESEKTDHD
jgi:choline dehydrogenase-like flavoprotein